MPNAELPDALDFGKGSGLVTVVTQDATSGVVLMLAHADREAVERTIATGDMHYFSRTRGAWHKGATSGNTQRVLSLSPDCDGDALLARVRPAGPACHTGSRSCFGESALEGDAFAAVARIIHQRASQPLSPDSYTQLLLNDRNRRLKKLGEEAAELIAACADGDAERAAAEAADLVYHIGVALESVGSSLDDVRSVLTQRSALAGLPSEAAP